LDDFGVITEKDVNYGLVKFRIFYNLETISNTQPDEEMGIICVLEKDFDTVNTCSISRQVRRNVG